MNKNKFTPQDGLSLNISKLNSHMLNNGIELKHTVYLIQLLNGKRFSSLSEPVENTYLPIDFNWVTNIEDNTVCIITKTNKKEIWELKKLLKDIWNGKYRFM